ncbi:poly-gamma-glutamate synthesis protein (capsule biosynthesis protein) [Sedimentibacter acidaminivorans]|jgi:poly-gamma-glutamate capsule biosynthesis protein CapA/YwtB (metallophosphatase superfamily)|uniref:Poly-gamma-glutamate synthesis protein (Capsule biosynthesis protein) n=1 Tax=Sedimentibacter acidaminivorans TaxID=913099 RepID=A0ABS4GD04_9FIRM|nr:CapA family protein [Sedimentibacter acidaminivorans]MBP1925564.1 poly-gamma-glutamate synthesis protein (capsule biosynthesis protein) [Sedimentibacter acidaminivorans]
MRKRNRRRRRKRNLRILMMTFILIVGIVAAAMVANGIDGERQKLNENDISNNNNNDINDKHENNNENNIVQPEPEPEPNPDITISIKATGDIMFHPSQLDGAYDPATGTYDFTNSFREVKSILQDADLAIANFEGTTAGNKVYAYQGYPLFNAPDEVLDAIKGAGFDVLSTVNNHCLDTRKAGIIRTIEQIQIRGMDTVGTYIEKPESRVLVKDIKGIKVAFMAYTEMVNGLESLLTGEELDSMVNITDETKMKEDIKYAKEQKVDVIIAFMHWGNEYSRVESQNQNNVADMLFSEGVDIILGSHPHVIQPSKILDYNGKKKFITFSMGNFISNQRIETLGPYGIGESVAKYTEDGVIVNIEIEKKGETGEVSINKIDYTPLWVYKGIDEKGRTEHVIYPAMNYIESDELNDNSKARMRRSYDDTMIQMDVE